MRIATGIAAVLVVAGIAVDNRPAGAVDLHKSRLTVIELATCRQISKHKDGGAWICPGLKGFPVYFAEGDLRHMLAFGPDPARRRSAQQTLGAFNSIFEGKRRPTIEWRTERLGNGREVPFATIVRYYTALDQLKGEAIVITKVDAKQSCQVAVIDAKANVDPIALAREWAITNARKKSCPDAPEIVGQRGQSPI